MGTHVGAGKRIYSQLVLNITLGGSEEEMKLFKGLMVHFRFWDSQCEYWQCQGVFFSPIVGMRR